MTGEKTVLHVGPVNTPGGMATVIRILSSNPPQGWKAQTLATHIDGRALSKLTIWRKARKELLRRIAERPPDVVHIHTASDFSWWRKRRVAEICSKADIPMVMHVHSGKFVEFCTGDKGAEVHNTCSGDDIQAIVLSQKWKSRLKNWLPSSRVVPNPVETPPTADVERQTHNLLFMGRPDPVKGAKLAVEATKNCNSEVILEMTGVTGEERWLRKDIDSGRVKALGWVAEQEKHVLMQESALLLMPSAFEAQPMVALEAMANGLPILCSPASEDTVQDAGVVVEGTNPMQWARHIEHLLNDEKRLEELRKKGLSRTKEHSITSVNEKWKEIYTELISRNIR